ARLPAGQRWRYGVRRNVGFSEMMSTLLLARLTVGPKKVPEIGRQLGKARNGCRRASNEFKAQIQTEITNLENEVHKPQVLPLLQPGEVAIASGNAGEAAPVPEAESASKASNA